MTEKQPSVRSDAEAANCTIPTFDEVYADPYVQDSIEFLINDNSIKFPCLAPFAEDIRQEMLLFLAKRLQAYDPKRAGIRTFCRCMLEYAILTQRRRYFNYMNKDELFKALPIHEISDGELYDSITNTENLIDTPFDLAERNEAVWEAVNRLLPRDKATAKAIMDGLTRREIIRRRICSCSRDLLHVAFPRIRAILKQNFS